MNDKYQLKELGISFAIFFVIIIISFKNNDFVRSLLFAVGTYYLFVLPGYFFLLNFKLGFLERLFAGTMLGGLLMSLFGYLIGQATGLSIEYYPYFLPIVFILIGIYWKKIEKTITFRQ